MGHRANFVLIREGAANAYFDNWAGLGAAFAIADGPGPAIESLKEYEPVDELLDWAFAEGGFLVDFDHHLVIVFGDLDDMTEEFSDVVEEDEAEEWGDEAGEGFDEDSDEDADEAECDRDDDGETDACAERYASYFREVAPRWQGWRLRYDDRGVDAFAEHLTLRGIRSIETQPPSHPESTAQVEFQA